MVESFNFILGILTLLGQLAIVFLLAQVFLVKQGTGLTKWIAKNAIFLSALIALSSVIGSLIYSEIIGYEPCKLCWFQRIFLYPQVIMLGIAWWKKHTDIRLYAIVFASISGLISLYQYLLQMGLVQSTACDATTVSCSLRYTLQFGYITIPMMAVTASLMILTFFYIQKRGEK